MLVRDGLHFAAWHQASRIEWRAYVVALACVASKESEMKACCSQSNWQPAS